MLSNIISFNEKRVCEHMVYDWTKSWTQNNNKVNVCQKNAKHDVLFVISLLTKSRCHKGISGDRWQIGK